MTFSEKMKTHAILSVSIFCCLLLLNGATAGEETFEECEKSIKEALRRYDEDNETNGETTACEYLRKTVSSECLLETGRCADGLDAPPRKRSNGKHTKSQARGKISQLSRNSRQYSYCPRDTNLDLECNEPAANCYYKFYDKYRTLDGTCNNLLNGGWDLGRADRIHSGFLGAAYDDGCGTPRAKSIYGGNLPNPRKVSNIIHAATGPVIDDTRRSLVIMQMGQFLAHDITLTHLFTRPDGSELQCCGEDMGHPQCFSINTPADDPHFPPGTCLNFARSEARQNCYNNIRDQVNSQSSFLDLSMVYGASDTESNGLRTLSGGLLKSIEDKLPKDLTDSLCRLTRPSDETTYYCPIAGDPRVTETPALAAIHTIWMREHNRLASELAGVHTGWDDETLFQEARRIAIAEWQHIVYAEYLPAVIGINAMIYYNININPNGYKDTYNAYLDPTLTNSFGAAILRYGHSLVPDEIALANVDDGVIFLEEDLKDNFFDPDFYHTNNDEGTDNLLKWQSTKRCPLSDRLIQQSVQRFLFLNQTSGMSMDLATFNIHRGRDHGLPGYNDFRQLCGLPRAYSFAGLVDHTSEVRNLLAQVYAHPDDIDLYPGFLSEIRVQDSQFGPTGQCLMLETFKRLRSGDRFFYERYTFNPSITFNSAQLAEIKKVKMSTVYCLNTAPKPGKKVPDNMFFVQSAENGFVDCSTVQKINLNIF